MQAKIKMGEHELSGKLSLNRDRQCGADDEWTWEFSGGSPPYDGCHVYGGFEGFHTELSAIADAETFGITIIDE